MRVVRTEGGPAWLTVGWLIAALVVVVDIVFMATGGVDLKVGLLIAGLGVAILL